MDSKHDLPLLGHIPEVTYTTKLSDAAQALIVPTFSDDETVGLAATGLYDGEFDAAIWSSLDAVGATGAHGTVVKVPAPRCKATGLQAIIAVGLGKSDELTDEKLRRAAGVAARACAGFETVATTLPTCGMEPVVEGLILGGYEFRGHKKPSENHRSPVERIECIDAPAEDSVPDDVAAHFTVNVFEAEGLTGKAGLVEAVIRAEAVVFARNLVNTPPLELYPESYAQALKEAANKVGVKVTILDDHELAQQGFGGILAVGQGSSRKPRFVKLDYKAKKASSSVALVGKGITFDTGGISLKRSAGMDSMTCDMAGSAAMAAAIFAAARLGLKVNVSAYLPLAENMPGGGAQRPGDVIVHYGGMTSEVLNTDAEGRLVLADAIARACEDDPDYLIETSTLTGAAMSALGLRTAGVMGEDDFRDRVATLGRQVGEMAWAMPIPEEIDEDVQGSDIADVRNIGTIGYGGMQAAGAYLKAAVAGRVPWAHLDVAGPAWNPKSVYGYTPKRGTGCPVRTVIATLADIAANG